VTARPLTPRPPHPQRGEGEPKLLLPLSPLWERGPGGEGGITGTTNARRLIA
jgi:hypothetical protein